MAEVALVLVVALAVVVGGLLVVLGVEALGPGRYLVSGTVTEEAPFHVGPAVGATVVLTVNGGATTTTLTDANGRFSFSNVAPGGISVNISASGYAPVTVLTFASPVYGTATTGLAVALTPGGTTNATTETLTPFPDLETFVASIGSAATLLGIVALLGGWAAVVTHRRDRPAVGVVGGAGGVLAPAALYILSLGGVFPDLVAGTAALATVGAFALTIRCLEIYQVGPESRTA
jgi:hypothetical protein